MHSSGSLLGPAHTAVVTISQALSSGVRGRNASEIRNIRPSSSTAFDFRTRTFLQAAKPSEGRPCVEGCVPQKENSLRCLLRSCMRFTAARCPWRCRHNFVWASFARAATRPSIAPRGLQHSAPERCLASGLQRRRPAASGSWRGLPVLSVKACNVNLGFLAVHDCLLVARLTRAMSFSVWLAQAPSFSSSCSRTLSLVRLAMMFPETGSS